MARKHKGVEVHKNRVRISIKWAGKWVYESTGFKPTDAGLAEAAKYRSEIQQQIDFGTFVYADHFPGSSRAQDYSGTIFDYAKKYIEHQRTEVAASTLKGYRKMLNNYWLPQLGSMQVRSVSTGVIRDAIKSSGLAELTAKTFNNAMTPLRGTLDLAIDYEAIRVNPCNKIKSKKRQKPTPDPLELHEMDAVLQHIRADWLPYFQVAFGTGMRPSELIELRWSDIDFNSGQIRVERGYVEQESKDTKTHKARIVEINGLALTGLRSQKAATWLAGGFVFLSNGKQINDHKPPRLIWDAALKKAGIRHRKAYSTRHTFASAALSAGKNPYMVAEQMGNSVQMLTTHYAKWIKQSGAGMGDLFSVQPAKTAD